MNELVQKVQNFLATDARATTEPGGMMSFEDGTVRIIADMVGSRKVRIYNQQTGEKLFLGTPDSPASEDQAQLISHLDGLIAEESPKAMVKPDDGKNVKMESVPEAISPSSATTSGSPEEVAESENTTPVTKQNAPFANTTKIATSVETPVVVAAAPTNPFAGPIVPAPLGGADSANVVSNSGNDASGNTGSGQSR